MSDQWGRFMRDRIERMPRIQEKEPAELSYQEFFHEYEQVMRAVATKERKGRLDPDAQPYEPMTEAERKLLESDWKAFSRSRGFTEADIAEYER